MATETSAPQQPVQTDPAERPRAKWWCNFCNFETDDQHEYMAHSCLQVLESSGKTVQPTGQNECR